jgi:ribonuclease HI
MYYDVKSAVAYTDGSCQPNPGPGGWGYIYHMEHTDGITVEITGSGGPALGVETTNNRMELKAVIELLKDLSSYSLGSKLVLYSDSKYVINCAQKLWARKKNQDLWREYDDVSGIVLIDWHWVNSHSGNLMNDRVDVLAKLAVKK